MDKVANHPETETKYKTKPYAHQLECLRLHGRKEYWALLSEMGTGKSWILINDLADLWGSGDCDAAVVFAPNGVHTNWTRLEIPKHMPNWVRYRAAAWTSSPNKREKFALENVFSSNGELRILTMNWEALQHKRSFDFLMKFVVCSRRLMIICDESDAIKNPSTARYNALMKIRPHSHYRRISSGTPINNAPFDFFSQFSFLDSFILGTTSYYAFKAEYAEMVPKETPLVKEIMARQGTKRVPQIVARGAGGRPRYKNLDKLSQLVAPHSYRKLKKECLDLPEKIYKTAFFELTPEQKAVYKKAKEECRIVFEAMETPFSKLTAIGKLAQITSGYYIHPASEEPVRIQGKNPKIELMIERVSAIVAGGEKVIIWARFRAEIEDIIKALREAKIEQVVEYHGGVTKANRVESIKSFEDGDASVFVGNQQSGGTGITLVSASNVIYYSNNWSYRDRMQSEDRAHRIGQTKNVVYTNIVAKGTIDEVVVKALESKGNVADVILDKGISLFEEDEF